MSAVARATPPRLLFVLNDARFFVSHRLPIARAALSQGFDVHLAVPPDPVTRSIAEAGIRVHDLPLRRSSTNVLFELRTLAALIALYRRVQPDLVHHVTAKAVLYGTFAARVTGVRAVVNAVSGLGYVFIARGAVAAIRRAAVRLSYRLALDHRNSRVILQNTDDREAFVARRMIRQEQAVLIRGSGVDTEHFAVTAEPPGIPVVSLPARMLRDKGIVEFVEAARLLRERGIVARFVLVGGTDVNPTAIPEAELRGWEKAGVIEWWGQRQDMAQVYARSTLVCLPSYREGLPKALLEAMASARAIVTTDVPGCREAVRHDDNGLLVPARDSSALAAAIQQLLHNPGERRAMAQRGRDRALAEFRVETVVAQTLALYRTLLT